MKFEDLKIGMWVVDNHGDRTQVVAIPDSPGEYVHGSVWSWCPLYNMDGVRPLTLGDLKPGERFSFVEDPKWVHTRMVDGYKTKAGREMTAASNPRWANPENPVSLVLDEGEAETYGHTDVRVDPDKAGPAPAPWVKMPERHTRPREPQWEPTELGALCHECRSRARWWMEGPALSCFHCTSCAVEAGMPDPYAEHTKTHPMCAERVRAPLVASVPGFTHHRTIANRKPDIVLGIDWD